MPELPGRGTPVTPIPNLPGAFPQPPQSERAAIEAKWAALRDAPVMLAELIIIINAHPELLEWAKAARFEPVPH